jgi:hypothetical protein
MRWLLLTILFTSGCDSFAQRFVTNNVEQARAIRVASHLPLGVREVDAVKYLERNGLKHSLSVGGSFDWTRVYFLNDGSSLDLRIDRDPWQIPAGSNAVLRAVSIENGVAKPLSNPAKISSVGVGKDNREYLLAHSWFLNVGDSEFGLIQWDYYEHPGNGAKIHGHTSVLLGGGEFRTSFSAFEVVALAIGGFGLAVWIAAIAWRRLLRERVETKSQ